MTDIFDEVEEDLRRERLKKVWDRFAPLIVGGAVLIVAGVGGWRLYQHLQTQWAAEAGDRYRAAMQLSNEGKEAEAAAAFAALGQDGTSGYRTIGRLRAAAELAERDPKAAIAAYGSFANDTAEPQALRDVARLRAGYLLVDNGTYAEARRTVEGLAQPGNPFRHGAREVLGLAAWKADNLDEARRWLEALVSDAEAPASARQRGDLVLDILNSPGPPPAPAPAAPLDLTPPAVPAPSTGIPSLTTGAPELPADAAPSLDASGQTPGAAVPAPSSSDQTPPAVPQSAVPPPAETPAPSAPATEAPQSPAEVAPASPAAPEALVSPPSSEPTPGSAPTTEPAPSQPTESATPPSAAAPTQEPASAPHSPDSATPSPETPPTVATEPPPAETSPPATAPAQ